MTELSNINNKEEELDLELLIGLLIKLMAEKGYVLYDHENNINLWEVIANILYCCPEVILPMNLNELHDILSNGLSCVNKILTANKKGNDK